MPLFLSFSPMIWCTTFFKSHAYAGDSQACVVRLIQWPFSPFLTKFVFECSLLTQPQNVELSFWFHYHYNYRTWRVERENTMKAEQELVGGMSQKWAEVKNLTTWYQKVNQFTSAAVKDDWDEVISKLPNGSSKGKYNLTGQNNK